jgi:hypothetical protein
MSLGSYVLGRSEGVSPTFWGLLSEQDKQKRLISASSERTSQSPARCDLVPPSPCVQTVGPSSGSTGQLSARNLSRAIGVGARRTVNLAKEPSEDW